MQHLIVSFVIGTGFLVATLLRRAGIALSAVSDMAHIVVATRLRH
jgi:hypothetical protein